MIRFTIVLAALAAPASAQEVDCTTALAQQEMNICAEADWKAADEELNATYKEVMAEMKAMDTDLPQELRGAEVALREAQRAWIPYRDANCQAAGFLMRGGSAEPLLVYGCLRQTTLDRIDALRRLVAN